MWLIKQSTAKSVSNVKMSALLCVITDKGFVKYLDDVAITCWCFYIFKAAKNS